MAEAEGKAVIWDMDGTLVDTADLHFQAWQALCAAKGLPFTRADFNATFGQRNPEILRGLFGDRFTDLQLAELADRKEELYRAAAGRGVELLPGVFVLLERLHQAGFLQAIASSAPRANLDLILHLTGIERFLQAVVASEDTQRGKPDPQVFLVAAERLRVPPPRCVVVEDAVAGVQAARAAHMKSIAVRFVGHHPETALRQAGADLVVATLEEVTVDTVEALLRP
jgi:beta-phosphoglucomutase